MDTFFNQQGQQGLMDDDSKRQMFWQSIGRAGAQLLTNANTWSRAPSGPLRGVGEALQPRPGEMLKQQMMRMKMAQMGQAGQQAKPPTTREFKVGNKYVTKQWNSEARRWDVVSEAGRYRPGSTNVTVGGTTIQNYPLPRRAAGAVIKEVMSFDDSLIRLNRMTGMYKDEYSTYKGQAKGWISSKLEKAGVKIEDREKYLAGYSKWVQESGQFFNAYRKFITGVAAGEKEIKLLHDTIPNVNDSPTEYKSKMTSLVALTQQLRNRHFDALKLGLKPGTPDYTGFLKSRPLTLTLTKPRGGTALRPQAVPRARRRSDPLGLFPGGR